MKKDDAELEPCLVCKLTKKQIDKLREKTGKEHVRWESYCPILYFDAVLEQWFIHCQNCGATVLLHCDREETIEEWNNIRR